MARKGLGKGLGAIFGSDISVEKNENATGTLMVDINFVEPNKNQPRKDFRKVNQFSKTIWNYSANYCEEKRQSAL